MDIVQGKNLREVFTTFKALGWDRTACETLFEEFYIKEQKLSFKDCVDLLVLAEYSFLPEHLIQFIANLVVRYFPSDIMSIDTIGEDMNLKIKKLLSVVTKELGNDIKSLNPNLHEVTDRVMNNRFLFKTSL